MTNYRLVYVMVFLVVVLVAAIACQPIKPLAMEPEPLSPEEVLRAATSGWDAEELSEGIIDATLVYFSDDAVYEIAGLPSGLETYAGHDEIRAWITGLLADDFRMEVEILESEGPTVICETRSWMNWSRETGIAPIVATEEYAVQDGQITHVTWTIRQESLEQLQAVIGGS